MVLFTKNMTFVKLIFAKDMPLELKDAHSLDAAAFQSNTILLKRNYPKNANMLQAKN